MFYAQSTITVISGRYTFDRYILRKKGEVKGGDSGGGEAEDSEGDNEGRECVCVGGGGGCEGRTERDSKVGYIMGKREAEAEGEERETETETERDRQRHRERQRQRQI